MILDLRARSLVKATDPLLFGRMDWLTSFLLAILEWLLLNASVVYAHGSHGKPKIATTLCVAKEGDVSLDVKKRREVLRIYDTYKRGADQFGQLYKGQYPIGYHENWLTTMIIGWFYFALTNAYILYSMKYDNLTHEQFVYEIAKRLI